MKSPFLNEARWLEKGDLGVVVSQEGYEVSAGHCLIVPFRIVETVFEMTDAEWRDALRLLYLAKDRLDQTHHPDGYNIGVNCGAAAGQTILHAHIHLIPRFIGDHPNPKGGVRAVIPDKEDWTKGSSTENQALRKGR